MENNKDDDTDNDIDDGTIRTPDQAFNETLIDNNSDYENLDPEMKLALEVSRKEYYDTFDIDTDINTVFFKSLQESNNFSYEDMTNEEQNKIFEQEVKLALEVSDQIYIKDLEQESYSLENDNSLSESDKEELEKQKVIEMEKRSQSLENFKKRIQALSLSLSFNDSRIKKYIEKVLINYCKLLIDFVYVDIDIYEDLYKVIDSYYLIPTQKNYKKTAISKEEDKLIRSIFRQNPIISTLS
jgi:hypothetical protein